jgi:hypothetical protein
MIDKWVTISPGACLADANSLNEIAQPTYKGHIRSLPKRDCLRWYI